VTPSSKTLKSRCTPPAARVRDVGALSPLEPSVFEPLPTEPMPTEPMPMEHADTEHGTPEGAGSKRQDPEQSGPKDPLRPIGTARLRALREAIRNGTYPTEAHIVGGLERLFEDGPQ